VIHVALVDMAVPIFGLWIIFCSLLDRSCAATVYE